MTIDMDAARAFMATHARTLDRRRFELLDGGADPAGALAALEGYGNPDGGYGWGLEGDLRSHESQPAAALHAFEVFAEVAPTTTLRAPALCDWLRRHTLPDGALPMAVPMAITAGSGPWWHGADPAEPSLQITSVVAARAWDVARHDEAVAGHPWLERATAYTLGAIAALEQPTGGYVLAFCLQFLDAVHDRRPEAAELLYGLGALIPDDGHVAVHGGAEDEKLRPLDLSPAPDAPSRALFDPAVIDADLDRLASGQQDDGGWTVDFESRSPPGSWTGAASRPWRRSPCCAATAAASASAAASPAGSGPAAARRRRRRPSRGGLRFQADDAGERLDAALVERAAGVVAKELEGALGRPGTAVRTFRQRRWGRDPRRRGAARVPRRGRARRRASPGAAARPR